MIRIVSVLATTLLAAGLAAQAFAAELPTSANFNDKNASQHDVRRVLGDPGFTNVKILAKRSRVFDVTAVPVDNPSSYQSLKLTNRR